MFNVIDIPTSNSVFVKFDVPESLQPCTRDFPMLHTTVAIPRQDVMADVVLLDIGALYRIV